MVVNAIERNKDGKDKEDRIWGGILNKPSLRSYLGEDPKRGQKRQVQDS